MIRRNRIVRNQIESAFGIGAIDEIERWNDRAMDSLEGFGLELTAEEEAAQDEALERLTQLRASAGSSVTGAASVLVLPSAGAASPGTPDGRP